MMRQNTTTKKIECLAIRKQNGNFCKCPLDMLDGEKNLKEAQNPSPGENCLTLLT